MKSVYALLVGIAGYPPVVNSLFGCKNDVEDMDQLFREIFTPQHAYDYESCILLDNQAKRRNIIEGFDLFGKAKENDICIFYYSGHGSLVKTNATFWTDGSDRLRSLVCYDSRFPSGYDLVDKELSYLIWKATFNKPDIHFVSIMDCCFSGSNTRSVSELNRMFDENENVKPVEEFEGFGEYVNNVPRRGRYIALSASQSNEPSKEKSINGIARGVFTYSLTYSIRNAPGPVTYPALIESVKAITKHQVQLQTPQLEAYSMQEDTGLFGQQALPGTGSWFLFYNAAWKISRGSMHGVKPGDLLRLENGGRLTVTTVGTNDSTVAVTGSLDTAAVYNVFPERTIALKLRYFLHAENQAVNTSLQQELASRPYEGIEITGTESTADYIISCVDANKLVITEPGAGFSLFERVNVEHADLFLRRLEHVAKWASVVNLFNPEGSKLLQAIAVDFRRVDKNGTIDDTLPSTPVDINKDHRFEYIFDDNVQKNPAFRLSFRNNYTAPLYGCILYCSSDFGVTDMLLPNTYIDRGGEGKAGFESEGRMNRTVPLTMDALYYKRGKKEIAEYIIIIVSELPVDSASFRLDPLPLDEETRSAGLSRSPGTETAIQPDKPVWGTIRIPVRIFYPA